MSMYKRNAGSHYRQVLLAGNSRAREAALRHNHHQRNEPRNQTRNQINRCKICSAAVIVRAGGARTNITNIQTRYTLKI